MVKLWTEWDFGQDYFVFTSEEKAKAWLWEAMQDQLDQFSFTTPDCIFNEGFAGFHPVTVI